MKISFLLMSLLHASITLAALPSQKYSGAITRDRTYSGVSCNADYVWAGTPGPFATIKS